jgi:hypothetical protein
MPDPGHPSGEGRTDDPHRLLVRALTEIQRRGAIGSGPIEHAIAHGDQFVAALPSDLPAGAELIDLGSGGGLPGLVIVARRPDLRVTLVERRAKRADLLAYGVRMLDAGTRVSIVASDVEDVVTDRPSSFDVVTARSFAAPPVVLDVAARLLVPSHGWLLVSEPPDDPRDRWPATALVDAGLHDDGRWGAVRRFHRR